MARSTERALREFVKILQSWESGQTTILTKNGASKISPLFRKGIALQANTKLNQVTQPKTQREKKAQREAGKVLPPIVVPTIVIENQKDQPKETD